MIKRKIKGKSLIVYMVSFTIIFVGGLICNLTNIISYKWMYWLGVILGGISQVIIYKI